MAAVLNDNAEPSVASLLCPFFHHSGPDDLDLVHRSVLSLCLDQAHALNHSHPALHATKDCMLSIQPRCWRESNEKLTAICIGAAVRHAENTSSSMLQIAANLVLEFFAVDRAASAAGAGRITGLDHEVGDNAVEDDIVVVASLCESGKVLAGLDSLILGF